MHAISSEEVLICQTCGAKGFTNAFIYCVKCLGFVIHRYCLDVIPNTADELVIWHCDDCKPPRPYHFTSPSKHDPSQSHKEDPPNSALVRATHPKKKQKKKQLKKKKTVSLAAAGKDNEYVSGPNQIIRCVVLGLEKQKDKSLQLQEKVATTSSQHVKTTKHKKLLKKKKKLLKKKKKKRESVPLLGKDEISCPHENTKSNCQRCVETSSSSLLKEASVNSDSGAYQITRCVVLGLEKSKDKSLQLEKNVAFSLQHVKTSKRKKLLKEKQKKKRESAHLLGKDETSCPHETAKSNGPKCVETPSNSLLKEALVNLDSGTNQITPESAELDYNYCPMKGSVKRKSDRTRVAVKTKKHKTEKSIEHSSCESSCTDVKNEEDITPTEEGLRCECVPDHDKLVSNCSPIEKELNKGSKEFNDSAFASHSNLENSIHYIHNQPARPVLDPVWRGSFNITKKYYDIFEGFVGHLSNKACNKVCEEATILPSMLSLEMHSKAHLWPKSFLDSMPTDENIALYFFPRDAKNERSFEQLVNNMIDEDLAMKATAKNAELLIFTSKVLPQAYWRFQGNYYLWGVFRGKKKDVPVLNDSANLGLSANPGNEVTSEKKSSNG